jgi:hypothetical protein
MRIETSDRHVRRTERDCLSEKGLTAGGSSSIAYFESLDTTRSEMMLVRDTAQAGWSCSLLTAFRQLSFMQYDRS